MKWTPLKLAVIAAAAALAVWGLIQGSPERATGGPQDVLAVVGGEELTRVEVEAVAPEQFLQMRRQLHQLTERALDEAVRQKLLDLEAERLGVSVPDLLSSEVDGRLAEPTEAQIDSVYREHADQLNAPREGVADRIRDFLRERAKRSLLESYIGALKAQYEVESRLDLPRTEVASAGFPARGPEDAPVTIVEFGDFECPFCYRVIEALERVQSDYGDRVRLVYRQFPLRAIHPHAQKASEASLCAHEQGRFWEMHDAIYEVRGSAGVDALKQMAAGLGLDAERFSVCLDSGRFAPEVEEDLQAGSRAGVTGTPALFINGRFLSGAQPYEVIARIVDDELRRVGG